MKALHTTMTIVIAAIVILTAALVILAVFGIGITNIISMTDLQSQCSIQGSSACKATGSLPNTWNSKSFMVNNVMMSCREATGCYSCPCILGEEIVRDYEPRESIYAGDSEGRDIGIELPEESIDIALDNYKEVASNA